MSDLAAAVRVTTVALFDESNAGEVVQAVAAGKREEHIGRPRITRLSPGRLTAADRQAIENLDPGMPSAEEDLVGDRVEPLSELLRRRDQLREHLGRPVLGLEGRTGKLCRELRVCDDVDLQRVLVAALSCPPCTLR